MNNTENEKEFSAYIIQILRILRKYLIFIIIITVVVGAGAYIYSANFIKPRYTASALLYVSSRDYSQSTTVTSGDLSTAARLVSTYSIILKTDKVLEEVVKHPDVNNQVKPWQIKGAISASAIGETEIFRVSYSDTNPVRAWAVTQAIADIGPDAILDVVDIGTATTIEYPSLPTVPYYPNVQRNTIIAAVIAFFASSVFFVLISLLDNRIHTEEDLEEAFDYPVFGYVPTIVADVNSTDSTEAEDE